MTRRYLTASELRDMLERLSDSAFEAQSALTTIKSFAYGGIATEHEARASIEQLRAEAERMLAALEAEQCPTR